MPHRLHAELLKPRLNWLPLWWWAGYAAAGQWGHKRNKWIGHHSYIARGKTGGKGNEVKEWILNKSPMHRLLHATTATEEENMMEETGGKK